MRGRISRWSAPHPNPLPKSLAIRFLIVVTSIAAKLLGRGDFLVQGSKIWSLANYGTRASLLDLRPIPALPVASVLVDKKALRRELIAKALLK